MLETVEACRGTLRIGLGFFWEKILDQHNNPIPWQLFVIDGQYRPTSFFLFCCAVVLQIIVLFALSLDVYY